MNWWWHAVTEGTVFLNISLLTRAISLTSAVTPSLTLYFIYIIYFFISSYLPWTILAFNGFYNLAFFFIFSFVLLFHHCFFCFFLHSFTLYSFLPTPAFFSSYYNNRIRWFNTDYRINIPIKISINKFIFDIYLQTLYILNLYTNAILYL